MHHPTIDQELSDDDRVTVWSQLRVGQECTDSTGGVDELDNFHDEKAEIEGSSYFRRLSDCATMIQGSCMGAALAAIADAIYCGICW